MATRIDPVDPQSMLDIFQQTNGNLLARMTQVVALAQRDGITMDGYLARQLRLQAFSSLLTDHPRLKETYSEKALISACATCILVQPPINPVGGDETTFELAEFERVAARAEL
ncbi:hypothetical protein [Bradyrhizobium sp. CSS354]|uniref:hypothetical protein n=1 Tax=Bradyrhizobium sp. CSS354 TaxID=2699172 RepID=UPI0023B20587|nr:hypothetical protein [Bradyrhizobium sp. CSS354]MDE5465969.1 hypothetical protein [Bradyrhizobium sp. CSS354]